MSAIELYAEPQKLPASSAQRIARLIGIEDDGPKDEVGLARTVAQGFLPVAAVAIGTVLGPLGIAAALVPEATLRRARKEQRRLSPEASERIYEIGRVLDAVGLMYQGDQAAMSRFLNKPHPLLDGETPFALAASNSAGADAVMGLLRRADAGFAV